MLRPVFRRSADWVVCKFFGHAGHLNNGVEQHLRRQLARRIAGKQGPFERFLPARPACCVGAELVGLRVENQPVQRFETESAVDEILGQPVQQRRVSRHIG